MTFFGLKQDQDLENQAAPPPPPTSNSQEYPPGFKTTNLPCVDRVAFFDDKQRNVTSGVPLLLGSLHEQSSAEAKII